MFRQGLHSTLSITSYKDQYKQEERKDQKRSQDTRGKRFRSVQAEAEKCKKLAAQGAGRSKFVPLSVV